MRGDVAERDVVPGGRRREDELPGGHHHGAHPHGGDDGPDEPHRLLRGSQPLAARIDGAVQDHRRDQHLDHVDETVGERGGEPVLGQAGQPAHHTEDHEQHPPPAAGAAHHDHQHHAGHRPPDGAGCAGCGEGVQAQPGEDIRDDGDRARRDDEADPGRGVDGHSTTTRHGTPFANGPTGSASRDQARDAWDNVTRCDGVRSRRRAGRRRDRGCGTTRGRPTWSRGPARAVRRATRRVAPSWPGRPRTGCSRRGSRPAGASCIPRWDGRRFR